MERAEAELGPNGAAHPHADTALDFSVRLRRSFPVLWRIAASIVGDSSMAEDVVQEAAVIALGKLDQFRPGTIFNAWMGQMVRYVALNHVRKEIRHRSGATDPAVMDRVQSSATRPGQVVGSGFRADGDGGSEWDGRIAGALSGVGDVARACLLLRTLDGLEYSRIAEILGIPEGTAMSHVHRTRKLLRRMLAEQEPRASDQRKTLQ